jgi:hypothetical protein
MSATEIENATETEDAPALTNDELKDMLTEHIKAFETKRAIHALGVTDADGKPLPGRERNAQALFSLGMMSQMVWCPSCGTVGPMTKCTSDGRYHDRLLHSQ